MEKDTLSSRVSAAYRGADFEAELRTTHEEYQRLGLAVVTKHEVRKVRRRDGTFIYASKSISDFTGILAGGRFVAFDAKSLRRPTLSWRPDARQLHQLDYLCQVAALGGLGFYLVRNGMDEARLVMAEHLSAGERLDLSGCPLIRRTYSSKPWDWLPVLLQESGA